MSVQLPAVLKSADMQRFATRAAQLEKYKPIASYWLEYYVLQQILTRALHNTSPEVAAYAAQLMDKVEATKNQYGAESAIVDDVAAQAYMEQLAAETLARAEKAQQEDTVTRQTADTLQAAATFYDSTAIWGDLSAETKAKIKFAKFHALRIAKALKDGRDPNEGNHKQQSVDAVADPDEIEIQDELRKLEEVSSPRGAANHPSKRLNPTVEDSLETGIPSVDTDMPPIEEATNYFPPEPPPLVPDVSSAGLSADDQPIGSASPGTSQPPGMMSTHEVRSERPAMPSSDTTSSSRAARRERLGTPMYSTTTVTNPTGLKTDDDAVIAAQKHAKWAISALNFEDVPTAVKELQLALQSLGGL